MVGYPEESVTFLRLVVVASSMLPLISVGVGLMSVLSMPSPLLRNAHDRMSSGQLAKSSFVVINAGSQAVSGSTNFVSLSVGIVEGRSFSDLSTPGPAQGHRSRVPSRTCPPQTSQ